MKNPVIALLEEYQQMRRNEIISHINSWWFNIDGRETFNQARDSRLIIRLEHGEWSLRSKPSDFPLDKHMINARHVTA